jgi:hypothetical protein
MTRQSSHTGKMCASCDRWNLIGASEADKAAGVAQCLGYDRPEAWDTPFCVLYVPARDLGTRRAWVREFRAAQPVTQQETATDGQPTEPASVA